METFGKACADGCAGAQWWHPGECLPDEGVNCGGFAGWECVNPDLYCTCPGCVCANPYAGLCLPHGVCVCAEDCSVQDLPHDGCVGRWSCVENACQWNCD